MRQGPTDYASSAARGRIPRALLACGLLALGLALLLPAGAAARSKTLITSFADGLYDNGDPAVRAEVFDETVDLGAGKVRLTAKWRRIAPRDPGAGFEPSDPGAAGYDWVALDAAVRDAAARNLEVSLLVTSAPDWAETKKNRPPPPCPNGEPCDNDPNICPVTGPFCAAPGTWKPQPKDLAAFATAVARRYSGSYDGLPRVREYQLWAEPNQTINLTPQWNSKKAVAPTIYAKMLRAFYKAVHRVQKSNSVITGGTAPYGAGRGVYNMRPLLFWRKLLCVKGGGRHYEKTKCPVKPRFDVLAHHPINTSGGPRRHALNRDDISTPDLKRLVGALRGAERAGTVRPSGRHPVRATELWWESNPPDPAEGHPSLAKQADWYAEALYLLWKQGAEEVTLLQVRDQPYDGTPGRISGSYQSGVLFADGSEKPAADVMRFPFVADRKARGKVQLWGRAPAGGALVVERERSGGGFKPVFRRKVAAGRVFTGRVRLRGSQRLRARVAGSTSPTWRIGRR